MSYLEKQAGLGLFEPRLTVKQVGDRPDSIASSCINSFKCFSQYTL